MNERYIMVGQTGSGKRRMLTEMRATHPNMVVIETKVPKDFRPPFNPYMSPGKIPAPVRFRMPEEKQS